MNVDLSRLMATEEKPGDYVGSDGLLYCGKCHTPKQMWLSFDPSTGGKKQTLVHTACKCQKEAREAERERAEHERSARYGSAPGGWDLMSGWTALVPLVLALGKGFDQLLGSTH